MPAAGASAEKRRARQRQAEAQRASSPDLAYPTIPARRRLIIMHMLMLMLMLVLRQGRGALTWRVVSWLVSKARVDCQGKRGDQRSRDGYSQDGEEDASIILSLEGRVSTGVGGVGVGRRRFAAK